MVFISLYARVVYLLVLSTGNPVGGVVLVEGPPTARGGCHHLGYGVGQYHPASEVAPLLLKYSERTQVGFQPVDYGMRELGGVPVLLRY